MYSAQVLDHFQHPRNVGDVENADASAQIENPACGDVLRLSVKIRDGVIAEAKFRAKGCVPAMACGSKVTELVAGKRIVEAQGLKRQQLAEALGGLPAGSDHAAQLALDALHAALSNLPRKT